MATSKKFKLRSTWDKNKAQSDLKQKYGIKENAVIVVERKNIITNSLRVLIKALAMCAKLVAGLLIAFLAIVGLATFIYPNMREELFATIILIFNELQTYF